LEIRERIIQKADEICRKVGFRAMTLDEIASQLSISKKTIYQYFKDKDELVDQIMEIEIKQTKEDCLMCSESAENAIDEYMMSLEIMCQDMRDTNPILLHDLQKFYYPTFLKLFELKNSFFTSIVSHNLRRGIEEGIYEKEIDIDILTKMRIETIMLPLQQEIFPADKYDFVKVNEVMLYHFLNGIITDKGRILLKEYKNKSTI
jgi:TetR/AcrR family transcriptional regulator, cholesterol catabolism regulator